MILQNFLFERFKCLEAEGVPKILYNTQQKKNFKKRTIRAATGVKYIYFIHSVRYENNHSLRLRKKVNIFVL